MSQETINMNSPITGNHDDSNLSELADFFAATFLPTIVDDKGEDSPELKTEIEKVETELEPYRLEPVCEGSSASASAGGSDSRVQQWRWSRWWHR